ncbi:MAG: glycosyltransferase [Methanospirillaceae archaeon]|nr:glycosyltransferase [Methanospirillaceae archaeon]
MNYPTIPRIAIIGPSFRFLSGISYYTALLANALAKEIPTTVILFRHMLPRRLFFGRARVGDTLSSISYDPHIQVHEILDWFNPHTWIAGHRIMQNTDIIVFQWWTSSVAHMYLALVLLQRREKPLIIEFHEVVDPFEGGLLPLRIYATCTASCIRNHADAFVVHSTADRDLVSQRYKIPEENIHIIPVGLFNQYPIIEKEHARDVIRIKEKYVLLFFGLIRPYKGVSYLIDAFLGLDPHLRESMHLLIIGEAWEDQESCTRAKNSPLKEQITCINRYISDTEIPSFFSAADMLILPYLRASQSGVAHIGISYGLPVIASKVGGLSDSLGGYEGTIFVRPGVIKDLQEAIINVITGEKKRYNNPKQMQWDEIRGQWRDLFRTLTQPTDIKTHNHE